MVKRYISKFLAGIVAASMLITPITVCAEELPDVPGDRMMVEEGEHFNYNNNSLEINNGTIDNNENAIETNNGTVQYNQDFYYSSGELGGAWIDTNNGTVVNNLAPKGADQADNPQGIGTNNNQVVYNNGYVDNNAETGNVINNMETGLIENNNGIVTNNDGKIHNNKNQVVSNTGEVTENKGTVSNNLDYVGSNDGTVQYNNGLIQSNNKDGVVNVNNGTNENGENKGIFSNEGIVEVNNGYIIGNDGAVKENNSEIVFNNEDGTIEKNFGYVGENNGVVEANYGENAFVNNGINALKQFFEYVLTGGTVDTTQTSLLDNETKGKTWVGSETGEDNMLTVRASDGKELDKIEYADGGTANVTDNGDGSWTITGIVKKIVLLFKDKTTPELPPAPGPGPSPTPGPGPSPEPSPDYTPDCPVQEATAAPMPAVTTAKQTVLVILDDSISDAETEYLTMFCAGMMSANPNLEVKFVSTSEFNLVQLNGTDFVIRVGKTSAPQAGIFAPGSTGINIFFYEGITQFANSSNVLYINKYIDAADSVMMAGYNFATYHTIQ